MSRIGFKTKEMERQERLPVVSKAKQAKEQATEEELALLLIQERIRRQAIELVDNFLFRGYNIDYVADHLCCLKNALIACHK